MKIKQEEYYHDTTNSEVHIATLRGRNDEPMQNYIKYLFKDARKPQPIKYRTISIKIRSGRSYETNLNNKTSGLDHIYNEWMKLLSNDNIGEITAIFNQINDEERNLTLDWLRSILISFQMKLNVKKYSY